MCYVHTKRAEKAMFLNMFSNFDGVFSFFLVFIRNGDDDKKKCSAGYNVEHRDTLHILIKRKTNGI